MPEFLTDEKLGYIAMDTEQRNLQENIVAKLASLSSIIFKSRRRFQKFVMFSGTGIIRKDALGAWPEFSITEDFAATLKMKLGGWTGKFVSYVKLSDCAPSSLERLKTMFYRYSKGSTVAFIRYFRHILISRQFSFWEKCDVVRDALFYPLMVFSLFLLLASVLFDLPVLVSWVIVSSLIWYIPLMLIFKDSTAFVV